MWPWAPLPLHSNPIVKRLRTIYGKRWNAYVTDSTLDKLFERGKDGGWKEASPNRAFLPFWTQMSENSGERRREEEKKGRGGAVPKSRLARDSLEPVCGHGQSLHIWKLLF